MADQPSRPQSGIRPPQGVARAVPAAGRSVQRRNATARKPTKILYSPVPIRETPRRRWIVGTLLTVAVLCGTIGWYRYLTMGPEPAGPLVSLPPTGASRHSGVSSTSSRPPDRPKHPSIGPTDRLALPDSFSAKQLNEFLRSQSEGSGLFDRQYRDQEVTWEGIATSVSRTGNLLGVEFEDRAGMHILAWCVSEAEISSGAAVRARGRLTRWRADGFVLDECQLQ